MGEANTPSSAYDHLRDLFLPTHRNLILAWATRVESGFFMEFTINVVFVLNVPTGCLFYTNLHSLGSQRKKRSKNWTFQLRTSSQVLMKVNLKDSFNDSLLLKFLSRCPTKDIKEIIRPDSLSHLIQ